MSPAVIGTLDLQDGQHGNGSNADGVASWGPDAQAFLVVQTIDPLGVDRPALSPKPHMETAIPVPDSGFAANSLSRTPQLVLRIHAPGEHGPVALLHERAGTDPVAPHTRRSLTSIGPPLAKPQGSGGSGGPHHFGAPPPATSFCPGVRSATNVFRRRFSSSNCFNRRMVGQVPIPQTSSSQR